MAWKRTSYGNESNLQRRNTSRETLKGGKEMKIKHIEIYCNSLAECYARLRESDMIYVSDLGKKAKVVIDIDTDSPFDGSFINILESKEEK